MRSSVYEQFTPCQGPTTCVPATTRRLRLEALGRGPNGGRRDPGALRLFAIARQAAPATGRPSDGGACCARRSARAEHLHRAGRHRPRGNSCCST
eukprot:scaffold2187_cov109-Isochrysis_galbana.AAC.10